ncbi:hypothetical protein V8D89_009376 [Ganoderma adspersum]
MNLGSPRPNPSERSGDDSLASSSSIESGYAADTPSTISTSTSAPPPEVEVGELPYINATPGGEQGFYQLTAHMSMLFAYQHRLFSTSNGGILHHDINLGNILIDPASRSGILIDWDLPRLASELEDGPVEPNRTFQSALVLYYPRKPYRLSDDIESFIHAFRYLVPRFHPTDIRGVCCFAETYFERSVQIGGVRLGGETEMIYFRSKQLPSGVVGHPVLQALLDAIARCYHEFYRLVDCAVTARKYDVDIRSQQRTSVPEKVAQPKSEEMAAPAPQRASSKVRHMPEMFKHLDSVRPPSPPREVVVKVDACDIKEGFLLRHSHLIEFFAIFCSAGEWLDKHEDQFVARAAEEPVRMPLYEPIRGSSDGGSDMSRSQCEGSTQDIRAPCSAQAVFPAAGPLTSLATTPQPQPSSAPPTLHCWPAESAGPPTCGVFPVFRPQCTTPTSLKAPSAGPSSDLPCPDPNALASSASPPSTSSQVLKKRKPTDVCRSLKGVIYIVQHTYGHRAVCFATTDRLNWDLLVPAPPKVW